MNKVNIQGFHSLKNVIELDDRQFYYFYNENCVHTQVNEAGLQGLGLDLKLSHKAVAVYKYYYQHIGQVTDTNKVYLLVHNKASYKNLVPANMLAGLIDVHDFVLQHREQYPELDNFLGFAAGDIVQEDQDMNEDDQVSPFGYKRHLELSDILLGVKEGRYF